MGTAFAKRGTIKEQRVDSDEYGAASDGTGEGEISNNSADVEEPDDSVVRNADNRRNVGLKEIGNAVTNTLKKNSSVGMVNNFAFKHGVADTSKDNMSRVQQDNESQSDLSLSTIRNQQVNGKGTGLHSKKNSNALPTAIKKEVSVISNRPTSPGPMQKK